MKYNWSREDPAFPVHQVMSRKQHDSGSIYKLRGIILFLKGMVCANASSLPYNHFYVFLAFSL